MNKRARFTCSDCYFRQMALCALQLDAPCPTFRLCDRGAIEPPRQAMLIPRATDVAQPVRYVPQPQAA